MHRKTTISALAYSAGILVWIFIYIHPMCIHAAGICDSKPLDEIQPHLMRELPTWMGCATKKGITSTLHGVIKQFCSFQRVTAIDTVDF